MSSDTITLEIDGHVAILSNNRPDKHNAANNEMDARLWEALREIQARDDVRAVIWRGNGESFSSGRDLTELGGRPGGISDLEFIERGHRGTQGFFTIQAPIICALKGWVIGGSFERSLLCDIRVAGESAKMRLPEVMHGVLPDTGGTARLVQMAGHGLVADLALTGRIMPAAEALAHGIVSRVVADDALDETVLEMARAIAKAPPFTVKMFRRNLSRMVDPLVHSSMRDEAVTQSMVFQSHDYAEMRAARADEREPEYRGR
ncbi:MAG: enoyl-CoA hydratase/isomerase family protein [Deltaproteobacteria bacterium]|nr:enoyl-CoA hydratase/isomerase family protein [Deltaproteobacteria bacterium]MBW2359452.1 enoyl-CoA hydratase/isomerase family protein [Deltaproteobacteria bacterium]